ncbi:hypothetical protein [Xenorhabdus bovienii]|uniref:hypothetical protein n=1 Tax=Xenorhabdus bovienii TaxID=40576 RepID=UPI0023B2BF8C|nr:hypothetical protein [Xenorhabdus bovienii]MDE9487499.1 hypothetical protein [Xenorhabdus bovienii]
MITSLFMLIFLLNTDQLEWFLCRLENDRATIIANVSAQKAAAEKLADAIRRRSV